MTFDYNYILRNGFWLALTQIVTSALALVLTIAFTNYLSKDVFGTYKYILSIASIAMAFTLPGIGQAVIQSVAKGNFHALTESFQTKLKLSLAVSFTLVLGSVYYFYNSNSVLGMSTMILALLIPLSESTIVYHAYLNGLQKFKIASIGQIVTTFFVTIATIGVGLITQNVVLMVLTYFGVQSLFRTAFLILMYTQYRFESVYREKISAYGIKLSLSQVPVLISSHVDKIVVFQLAGAVELAIYSVASTFPEHIRSLLRNVDTLAMPRFSTRELKDLIQKIKPKLGITSVIIAITCLIYYFVAPTLFEFIFPAYSDSIFLSQILILGTVTIIQSLVEAVFKSQKLVKEVYIVSFTQSISIILLTILGVLFFGLIGAVVGQLLGRLLGVVVSLFLLFSLNNQTEV